MFDFSQTFFWLTFDPQNEAVKDILNFCFRIIKKYYYNKNFNFFFDFLKFRSAVPPSRFKIENFHENDKI
jgi:hypothetical protein